MINVNDFHAATDSDVFERAIAALEPDGILLVPPRRSAVEPTRDYWLLDRAILLPANTTVILQNATIKLSDRCRDNFFRSANCGFGFPDPERLSNIHIRGEGLCTLVGADHPRATGDGSKILACPCPKRDEDLIRLADWIPEERRASGQLDFWDAHDHSYGTDALDPNESHYGDWRGVGILLANVERFSIENLRIIDSHGWGISCEACAHGRIEKIDFDACMAKEIDSLTQNMENQDGIDLRNGCHDVVISDITGGTGDDLIALTAIAGDRLYPGGSLRTTHVMHSDWSRRERDIHDIVIRNVVGYSKGGICFHVRLLPANAKIYNVVIDGVIDASPEGFRAGGVLLLGEPDGAYGKNPIDGMRHITISNVVCDSRRAVIVAGYLRDSVISNVVNKNPDCPVIDVERKNGLVNVLTSNLCTAGGELIHQH